MTARATAFGLYAESVDGQDVKAVYHAAKGIIDRTRSGGGPAFLLCNTYRFLGHHVGDVNREYYRSKQEEQMWKTERDPVKLFADWLKAQNLADVNLLDQIQAEVKSEVEKAVQFAIDSPYPAVDKVDQDIYA
jgi:TPP-dependent pyruvate/acetoin dehydrogenase alpha subunit